MFHQPLIVAKPPWYRRSLRGWNPWGWRSLNLGQERYTGLMLFPDGLSRPGDGLAPTYVWDDGMKPARKDGDTILIPPFGFDTEDAGCVYHFDPDRGAWVPSDPEDDQ